MFDNATAIGADIGRSTIRSAVVRITGEIILSDSAELGGSQTKEYVTDILSGLIQKIRLRAASEGINPMCIGVAAKGFIDHKSGVILGPDQGIENWKNVPLAEILKERSGLPAYVGNDANMMTIAEHQFGAAKGFINVVFVALRTGIGGGIIINGRLYRGVNNAGGEFGQMIINFDNGVSPLGIKGSYEHLASATAVVRRYYEEKGNQKERKYSCREIFGLAKDNDVVAAGVIRENASLVGIGLANLISIFAPEIIIIGGGMSEAGAEYISMIRKSAFENSLENCRSEVRIERAELGSSASYLGAAFYALTRLAGKTI